MDTCEHGDAELICRRAGQYGAWAYGIRTVGAVLPGPSLVSMQSKILCVGLTLMQSILITHGVSKQRSLSDYQVLLHLALWIAASLESDTSGLLLLEASGVPF